jgi:predicted ATPase
VGAELFMPYWLALLAEVEWLCGHLDQAARTVEQGIEFAERNGEAWWQAELLRLKGELSAQQEKECYKAQAHLSDAFKLASRQGAPVLLLRIVKGLAPLWQQQGETEQAIQQLEEACQWFTEGTDTADLREAFALLSTLGTATKT